MTTTPDNLAYQRREGNLARFAALMGVRAKHRALWAKMHVTHTEIPVDGKWLDAFCDSRYNHTVLYDATGKLLYNNMGVAK
jgi:hypothetical protein